MRLEDFRYPMMHRRKFLLTTLASGAVVLPGCGVEAVGTETLAAAPPGPAPIPAPAPAPAPAAMSGNVYVAAYENNVGSALAESPLQMYWQSTFLTKEGTLIEWGTGDHNPQGDNGVREFDPVARRQAYVYSNNGGTQDQSQYDNLHYFYIPRLDSLVIPARGQYSRSTGQWAIGNLIANGRRVVGTGANDLFVPIGSVYAVGYEGTYNAHQAWSGQFDSGVCIAGGLGGDNTARPKMWIVVPSAGLGSYPQPYAIFERNLPLTVGGVPAHKLSGRDGCCFAGEYVYWVGGGASVSQTPTSHFFRMRITPHLRSDAAPLDIERLPDAPGSFSMGLLRFDPYVNALLCISSAGIYAFDLVGSSWADVTPQAYKDDYAPSPTDGKLPGGCMGDFVDTRLGQALRKFYWRPGINSDWGYDYGGTSTDRMYRRFRAIKLARK